MSENHLPMRFDLQIIASWIKEGSRVLDLGCGDGTLLQYLISEKKVSGTGIERQEEKVIRCIHKGLSILQGDLNVEVLDYSSHSFDYVIVSQTLQQVYKPAELLNVLLDIGRYVIVSFPNFGHYKCRWQLMITGHAPKTEQLPYDWFDTPNIRVISIHDFKQFAGLIGFVIDKEVAVKMNHHDHQGQVLTFLPNVLATNGIFLIRKR